VALTSITGKITANRLLGSTMKSLMDTSALKTWFKLQRIVWRSCRRHGAMRKKWPGLEFVEPGYWDNDDPECIEIGQCVHIGPYIEISVLKCSGYTNIPGRLADRSTGRTFAVTPCGG